MGPGRSKAGQMMQPEKQRRWMPDRENKNKNKKPLLDQENQNCG